MQQPYNILPKKTADRIAKTFYYNKKGEVRWWDGKQVVNKEKIKEANKKYKKKYRWKIKEDNKKYWCKYYKKYNECLNEKSREYRANPSNKKLINKRRRWRYKNDENYRLTKLLRDRFRWALKSQSIKKNSHVLELTSCSMDFLKNYLSKKFKKGMTWENQGQWHIDHRKPCASFDLAKKEEQRKCFHYTNLQPLWGKENIEKSATFNEATYEYKWTEEQGWVLR